MPNPLADLVTGVLSDRTSGRAVQRNGGAFTPDDISGALSANGGANYGGLTILETELWPHTPDLPSPFTGNEPAASSGATEVFGWKQTAGAQSSLNINRVYQVRGQVKT